MDNETLKNGLMIAFVLALFVVAILAVLKDRAMVNGPKDGLAYMDDDKGEWFHE
jgi:hypothetical protein